MKAMRQAYADRAEMRIAMFNMNNKRTRQRVSIVIIVILVLAMVIPTLTYFIY